MREGKPEWFTCLMPTYNAEAYIRQAIDSILKQTYQKFELLIIDDGSTDATPAIIKSFTDPRIRYIHKENGGISSALNLGLKLAKYDWIFRMDADDISLPTRFEEQISSCDFQFTEINVCDYSAFRDNRIIYDVIVPANKEDLLTTLFRYLKILHATFLYNREFILSYGGYNESVKNLEDYELICRVFEALHYSKTRKNLYLYHILYNSNSRTYQSIRTERLKFIHEGLMNLLDEHKHISDNEKFDLTGWFYFYSLEPRSARLAWKKGKSKYFSLKKLAAILLTYLPVKFTEYLILTPPKSYFYSKKGILP